MTATTNEPEEPRDTSADGLTLRRAKPKSGLATVRDMVWSLGLVGVVVAVLVAVVAIPRSQQEKNPVRTVPYLQTFQQASMSGLPYQLLGPLQLPDGWRATSVTLTPPNPATGATTTQWHIGFIDPADTYAAVEQTDGDAKRFAAEKIIKGAPAGTRTVNGEEWAAYDGPKYRGLLRTRDGVTTVVTGNARFEDLDLLAGALRPAPPITS